MSDKMRIYTIGHSNIPFKDFLKLLKSQDIKQLVDVRSSPYSKYASQYNREELKTALKNEGISYYYLGHLIGGKPEGKEFYVDGEVDYDLIAKKNSYQEGIIKLTNLTSSLNTVIMCSEENPTQCHRHKLITPTLTKEGWTVIHIRGNGRTQMIDKTPKKYVKTTLI